MRFKKVFRCNAHVLFFIILYSTTDVVIATIDCSIEDIAVESCEVKISCWYTWYDYQTEDRIQVDSFSYNNYYNYCNVIKLLFILKGSNIKQLPPTNNFLWKIPNSKIINILNLEDNDFENIPHLSNEYETVETLNLKRNLISTAKLYNEDINVPSLHVLDLSENVIENFESAISEHQYVYENLITLNVSHNQLNNIRDVTFQGLSALLSLDLAYNSINTLGVESFEGLQLLNDLNLSYNKIFDLNDSLFVLHELEELYLDNNNLISLKGKDFENNVNLKILSLKSNNINLIESNVFSYKVSLSHLYLNSNNIRFLPEKIFIKNNITQFNIEYNMMQGIINQSTFEGLKFITELNLSHQNITEVKDHTFLGFSFLKYLNISDNSITTLHTDCFRSLTNLKVLDLSNNKITHLDFDKIDLGSLTYLDFSNNLVTHLETKSFMYNKKLENLKLSNNPFIDALESYTFDGLAFLTELDISRTDLNIIKNYSCSGMTELIEINISHGNIHEIEYNSLSQLNSLEIIDLSFNKLQVFKLNHTNLEKLKKLDIRYNLLSLITSETFQGIVSLNELILSNNSLLNIQEKSFEYQKNISILDLSNNPDLTLKQSSYQVGNLIFIENSELLLSGCNLNNLSFLNSFFSTFFNNLKVLYASHNKIVSIEAGAFSIVKSLTFLDLSYNKIEYIKPGAFIDNEFLRILNISHNFLSNINYGVFHGLRDLRTFDFSYNNITSLKSERFTQLSKLEILIADGNKIKNIDPNVFENSTTLKILSIGHNPILCENLLSLIQTQKHHESFTITSIISDVYSYHIDGVTCKEYEGGTGFIPTNDIKEPQKYLKDKVEDTEKNATIITTNKDCRPQIIVANARSSSVFMETCVALILVVLICFGLLAFFKSNMYNTLRHSMLTRNRDVEEYIESNNL